MVKTTKRSRKFNAKGGTSTLEKKGTSLTKKGKTKRTTTVANNKKHNDNKSVDNNEEEKKLRSSNDFLNVDNLGMLDMDSFFEKAVGMGANDDDDEDGSAAAAASDQSGSKDKDNDNDDDSSVDSYTSLGSEEEDIQASEERMKRQLEKLSTKDPEFHKYLEDNESSLLEFGGDGGSGDEEDGSGGEEEEEYIQDEDAMEDAMAEILLTKNNDDDDNNNEEYPMQSHFHRQQKLHSNKFLLTPQRLQQLEHGAFKSHSIKGLKRIIGAYRTACHLSDANRQDDDDADESDDDGGGGGASGGGGKKKKEFQITSPVVFDRLMAVCLVSCHEEFYYHLLGEGSGLSTKDDDDDDDEKSNSSSSSGSGSDSEQEEEEAGANKPKKNKPTTTTLDENQPIHPKTLSKSPHFATLRPLLESFLKSTHHILTEAGKEAKLLQFVLSSLAKYIPYLTALTMVGATTANNSSTSTPKLTKTLLKTCITLWSAPLDTSQEYNTVRLQAFLRIRQLAITQPYPYIESILKYTYLSYAQRSKFGTASNVSSVLPTLTFMGNCIVELYTLDYASAYQHVFVYVRQLALLLRSAMMKGTEETRGVVVCWQFVHCLKLWVAVLCAAATNSGNGGGSGGNGAVIAANSTTKLGGGANKDEEANLLHSLVYPLTEIILGVCRLVPVARFAPLRLHCVRLLQQLAASTERFIPTTSLLLGILDLKEVGMKPLRDGGGGGNNKGKKKKKKKSSGATVRGLRLPLILKLPKDGTLRTMEQLDSVLKEVFVLLNREVDMYRYSPGFPEFTFAILQRLRKFNKEISNGRWRAYSKGTIELCEKYSTFAINGRATLTDAPKDVRRLEALKPPNVPAMRERYESAVAKEKRLEAATLPIMKQQQAKGKKADDGKAKRKRKDDEEEKEGGNESGEEEDGKAKKAKSKAKKKKKAVVNEADLKNVEALKEEDEVQEGIEWSDSDSE
ncbi:hypothetical protein ACHAXR_011768 [Thalassiosira sp. AJA248-18]